MTRNYSSFLSVLRQVVVVVFWPFLGEKAARLDFFPFDDPMAVGL